MRRRRQRAGKRPHVVTENNFYEDVTEKPDHDQRLDYILIKAGLKFVPIVTNVRQILKLTRNGRFISDHFGWTWVRDRIRAAFFRRELEDQGPF